ncbi:uncharacterized protein LOC141672327 isoform X1 [Apium graveolens]|uniref:uncharacterized protein LOC141672327 isoform X1 n=1 Tax=Apium graveolens TaxID=4045 RepID=UPI003D7B7945
MKIYSVSTKYYYAFGALVSEELSYKLKELPHVRWVLPDSYLDVKNKDYGGEPFINGQAVPYDPKYHEEWVRNNARANDRNRRNDRPRNSDRSRNFERRPQRGGPPGNMGGGPPGNMGGGSVGRGGVPNMGAVPQNNVGAKQQSTVGGVPNMGQMQNGNIGQMQHGNMEQMEGPSQNMEGMAPNNMRGDNMKGGAPHRETENFEPRVVLNNGGYPYQSGPGLERGYQNSYSTNTAGGNSYQTQDIPERNMPLSNYQ